MGLHPFLLEAARPCSLHVNYHCLIVSGPVRVEVKMCFRYYQLKRLRKSERAPCDEMTRRFLLACTYISTAGMPWHANAQMYARTHAHTLAPPASCCSVGLLKTYRVLRLCWRPSPHPPAQAHPEDGAMQPGPGTRPPPNGCRCWLARWAPRKHSCARSGYLRACFQDWKIQCTLVLRHGCSSRAEIPS